MVNLSQSESRESAVDTSGELEPPWPTHGKEKEIVEKQDGIKKGLLTGHASSTYSNPSSHWKPVALAPGVHDLDLTSVDAEVTVQTLSSNRPPENVMPSALRPITQQEHTPARNNLTSMRSHSFSGLDPPYFTPETYGFIPPRISRRHTYPPNNQVHGVGNSSNYSFGSGADEVFDDDSFSVASSSSYFSQHKSSDGSRFTSPLPSTDLQFIYTNWISPLKLQMDRIESEFQKFTTTFKKRDASSSPLNGDTCTVAGYTTPKPNFKSNAPSLAASDRLETTSEKPSSAGCYIGYQQKEKHRVWIENLTQQRLEEAENSATDYVALGKLLMQIIFSKELEDAGRWCCTKSKGRSVLNQEKLYGIRLHLHKKFLSKMGLKLKGAEETEKWSKALKKMNAYIRYRRSAALKEGGKSQMDPGSGSESEE